MRKRFSLYQLILVVALLVFTVGCAPLLQMIGIQEPLTPKERGIVMLAAYQFEYKDHQSQTARTDLTEPEKVVLRTKKATLIKVYPLIKTYQTYVDQGMSGALLVDLELQISTLMNELGSALIKKLL